LKFQLVNLLGYEEFLEEVVRWIAASSMSRPC
jgi:hypothetical protein